MISIDNRAGSKQLYTTAPLTLPRYPTELISFDTHSMPGDIAFEINGPNNSILSVGIEVKKLHDLASSIDDKRLTGIGDDESNRGQLVRMRDYYDISVLLWYGNTWAGDGDKPVVEYDISPNCHHSVVWCTQKYRRELEKRKQRLSRKHLDIASFVSWMFSTANRHFKRLSLGSRSVYFTGLHAAMFSIQLHGIHVIHVNSIREVALVICALYSWGQKPWAKHTLFNSVNLSTSNAHSAGIAKSSLTDTSLTPDIIRRAKLLFAYPGLGSKRAVAIAKHYSSDGAMWLDIIKNPSAWSAVPGISDNKSRELHRVITSTNDRGDIADRIRLWKH